MKKVRGMSYFQEVKAKRYEQIKRLVIKLSPISYLKLAGLIEIQYGLTKHKAFEHIGALQRAGYIEIVKEKHKQIVKVVK